MLTFSKLECLKVVFSYCVKKHDNVFNPHLVLSEWSGGDVGAALLDQYPAAPALQYVSEGVLQAWCRQAQWMEEALQELRRTLEVQLQQSSLQARGRALGRFRLN